MVSINNHRVNLREIAPVIDDLGLENRKSLCKNNNDQYPGLSITHNWITRFFSRGQKKFTIELDESNSEGENIQVVKVNMASIARLYGVKLSKLSNFKKLVNDVRKTQYSDKEASKAPNLVDFMQRFNLYIVEHKNDKKIKKLFSQRTIAILSRQVSLTSNIKGIIRPALEDVGINSDKVFEALDDVSENLFKSIDESISGSIKVRNHTAKIISSEDLSSSEEIIRDTFSRSVELIPDQKKYIEMPSRHAKKSSSSNGSSLEVIEESKLSISSSDYVKETDMESSQDFEVSKDSELRNEYDDFYDSHDIDEISNCSEEQIELVETIKDTLVNNTQKATLALFGFIMETTSYVAPAMPLLLNELMPYSWSSALLHYTTAFTAIQKGDKTAAFTSVLKGTLVAVFGQDQAMAHLATGSVDFVAGSGKTALNLKDGEYAQAVMSMAQAVFGILTFQSGAVVRDNEFKQMYAENVENCYREITTYGKSELDMAFNESVFMGPPIRDTVDFIHEKMDEFEPTVREEGFFESLLVQMNILKEHTYDFDTEIQREVFDASYADLGEHYNNLRDQMLVNKLLDLTKAVVDTTKDGVNLAGSAFRLTGSAMDALKELIEAHPKLAGLVIGAYLVSGLVEKIDTILGGVPGLVIKAVGSGIKSTLYTGVAIVEHVTELIWNGTRYVFTWNEDDYDPDYVEESVSDSYG